VKESRNLDKTISSIRKARRLGKMDADTEQAEISRVKAEKNQLLSKGKTLKAEIPIKGEG
jgi:hypothetical protein